MNYLAHAYLSFQRTDVLLGNMISDYVKGKKQFDYPRGIQHGIKLHRAIDNFTDTHPVTHELKSFFRDPYRLYAGAFADIVYDHFLAKDKNEFHNEEALARFAQETYQQLETGAEFFPPYFQRIFPYMKQHDWLSNYRFTWAIEKSFNGLTYRAKYLTESRVAFELFIKHYDSMQVCYDVFFPELKKFTVQQLDELLKN